MLNEVAPIEKVILMGYESVGKSAIFRTLTNNRTTISSNIRGSTYETSSSLINYRNLELIDTPGIRFDVDTYSSQSVLLEASKSDVIVLVVKAASIKENLIGINEKLSLRGRKVAIIVTHTDKYKQTAAEKDHISELLHVPMIWLDARNVKEADIENLYDTIQAALSWNVSSSILNFLPDSKEDVQKLVFPFNLSVVGPLMAILTCFSVFGIPVFLAYLFSDNVQSLATSAIINPIEHVTSNFPYLLNEILMGDYGLVTLGLYSFIWAFPVVLLVSLSTSLMEESGIQEHVTHALDPWLRKIGLTGRDLVPVLTGFGCNVVAVMQSRNCSTCTRGACVSLISFGSACSYQIGATLSIFGSAGNPILFIPYIFVLFFVGAFHTRLWNKQGSNLSQLTRVADLPQIQKVDWRAVFWKLKSVVLQFLIQAMPIFLLICIIASLLQLTPVIGGLEFVLTPLTHMLQLPADSVSGIVFSFIRKDGLLVLNQDSGNLLAAMTSSQIFVLVYFASTLSSCLVTLYSIKKEFGLHHALSLVMKQALTSIFSTLIIAAILYSLF